MATGKNKNDSRTEEDESAFSAEENNTDKSSGVTSENQTLSGSTSSKNDSGSNRNETDRNEDRYDNYGRPSSREDSSRRWSSGNGDRWRERDGSRGQREQRYGAQEEEQGYSRNWDTLSNDQYGQMTQGSYNPRNNPGFSDEVGDRNYRSNRSMYEEDGRNDRRNSDDDRGYRSQSRNQEWNEAGNYRRGGDRSSQGDGRDQWSRSRRPDDEYGTSRNSNNNNYGTRQYDPADRYGSHWHTGNQEIYRNQGGHYSDYENPPFDRDELNSSSSREFSPRSDRSRQYENYGSEFDNPYDQGRNMRDQYPDYGRDSARERGWSRGYQYGTDSYNSGTSRDNPRQDRSREAGSEYRDGGSRSSQDRSRSSGYSGRYGRDNERGGRDERDERGRNDRDRSDRDRNRR